VLVLHHLVSPENPAHHAAGFAIECDHTHVDVMFVNRDPNFRAFRGRFTFIGFLLPEVADHIGLPPEILGYVTVQADGLGLSGRESQGLDLTSFYLLSRQATDTACDQWRKSKQSSSHGPHRWR